MPSKKKKYNARFPPARIKKIMQSDEEVGKVAQAVPVIISRALELFVESLLKKAETVTQARNAKTLTPSHLKQCIMSEGRFDFLRELVSTIPDVQGEEELAETPTPTARNSSQTFSFPVPVQSQGQGRSRSSAAGVVPSAAVGSSQQQSIDSSENQQQRQEPIAAIAEYAQGLPYSPEQKSVIVSPQQHSYVLNPAGVTSNPYIPISTGSVGVFPVYAHPQPQIGQTPNPNGTTAQSYPHPDKNIYN